MYYFVLLFVVLCFFELVYIVLCHCAMWCDVLCCVYLCLYIYIYIYILCCVVTRCSCCFVLFDVVLWYFVSFCVAISYVALLYAMYVIFWCVVIWCVILYWYVFVFLFCNVLYYVVFVLLCGISCCLYRDVLFCAILFHFMICCVSWQYFVIR